MHDCVFNSDIPTQDINKFYNKNEATQGLDRRIC